MVACPLEGLVRQLADLLEKANHSGLVYPAKSGNYYLLLEAVDWFGRSQVQLALPPSLLATRRLTAVPA